MNTQLYFNSKQLSFPVLIENLISPDSTAITFEETFSKLDLSKFFKINNYEIRGRKSYNKINMLKLILFNYMEKRYSLREIEKSTKNNIEVMWLTNRMQVTHQTIKNFMDKYLKNNIQEIFIQLIKVIKDNENIEENIIYIDGTKIESRSNKYKFVWRGSIEKYRNNLFKKVTKLIEILKEQYQNYGIDFSTFKTYKIEYINSILKFINFEIEKKNIVFVYGKGKRKTALQRHYENIMAYIKKLNEYNEKLEIMGNDRNSFSKTDHSATFMRLKEDHMLNGQLKPAYNVQIGVSNEYIMNILITSDRSDYNTFIPFLEKFKKIYNFYPKYPVADAGYGGLKNYRFLKENNMELVQKYNMFSKDTKDKKRYSDPNFNFNLKEYGLDLINSKNETLKFKYKSKYGDTYYIKPDGKLKKYNKELVFYQKEAIKNLNSEIGIELRIQRSIQVEGAFGVLKDAFRFRRFKRFGQKNVEMEFYLLAIGYNLLKIHNKKYRITEID